MVYPDVKVGGTCGLPSSVQDMGSLKAMPSRLGTMPARVKSPPKTALDIYTSPEWRRLIAMIKRRRGPFCERCGAGGRIIGDHKVELKDGGAPLDEDNVELLCARTCHPAKTAAARAARARGEAGRSGSTRPA